MPFNYLSTVIIIEADTQPEEGETQGQREPDGKRKGETKEGAHPKLALLKSHIRWSLKFPCFGIM